VDVATASNDHGVSRNIVGNMMLNDARHTANSPKQLEVALPAYFRAFVSMISLPSIGAHGKVSWLLGRCLRGTQDGATGGAEGVARKRRRSRSEGRGRQVRLPSPRCECRAWRPAILSSAMISD